MLDTACMLTLFRHSYYYWMEPLDRIAADLIGEQCTENVP